MSVRLTIKTANIGRGVPTDRARTNMTRLRNNPLRSRWSPQAVLWQEIDDDDRPDEREILGELYPAAVPDGDQGLSGYVTWPPRDHRPGCCVPITLPRPWRIADKSATKVSDGKAGVSPDRYVTRLVATHPDLTDPVAFISFQLVAGAHTNPGQAAEEYRRQAWSEGFSGAKGIVNDSALDGLTVLGGCDANDPHMPAIHPRARVPIHRGLDYLWMVPGSVDVKAGKTGAVDLNIDGHNALYAVLDLTSKEN